MLQAVAPAPQHEPKRSLLSILNAMNEFSDLIGYNVLMVAGSFAFAKSANRNGMVRVSTHVIQVCIVFFSSLHYSGDIYASVTETSSERGEAMARRIMASSTPASKLSVW